MPVNRIIFNIRRRLAFIDNRKKQCLAKRDIFIDVFDCFKCPYYLGLIFYRGGLKIRCGKRNGNYRKAVHYAPADFDELLELLRSVKESGKKVYMYQSK